MATRKSDNYNRQLSVYKKAISDLYKSMHSDKTFKIKAEVVQLRQNPDHTISLSRFSIKSWYNKRTLKKEEYNLCPFFIGLSN